MRATLPRLRRRARRAVPTSGLIAAVVMTACSSSDGVPTASSPSSPEASAAESSPGASDSLDTAAVDTTAVDTTAVAPGSSGASSPSVPVGSVPVDPSSTATSATGGALPEGFTTVTARITEADGEVCDVCLWLADSADERARGLMGVDDLGEAVGMAFVFDRPILGAFYMFQTPTPLSIAWFGTDGAWVGSAEMAPCLDTPADECARYQPDAEYDLAIEVFADSGAVAGGGVALESLGLGPGAVVELLVGTEGPDCQTPSS